MPCWKFILIFISILNSATGVANMGIRAGGGLGYILMPALFSDIDLEDSNDSNTTIKNDLRPMIGRRFIIFQSALAGVSSLSLLLFALIYSKGC